MSKRIQAGKFCPRPAHAAIEDIERKRAAVRRELDEYYAGRTEGMSTDDAASLRGEAKAYTRALEAISTAHLPPEPKALSDR